MLRGREDRDAEDPGGIYVLVNARAKRALVAADPAAAAASASSSSGVPGYVLRSALSAHAARAGAEIARETVRGDDGVDDYAAFLEPVLEDALRQYVAACRRKTKHE
jgi:hypothetical protein